MSPGYPSGPGEVPGPPPKPWTMGESLNVRLPNELREKLEALAREGDRSLSREIRRALKLYVEAQNGKAK